MSVRLFGTDGMRGRVNKYPMTPEVALRLGLAAGTFYRDKNRRSRVGIGKDTRLSGYVFENALAAGLKSVGDSKTPLKFLAFSAVLNAVLDIVLIGGLGFGIVCSAVTSVVAEAACAIMAAWYMSRHVPQLCPAHSQWRIRPALLGRNLQYGAVTALQQAVQPV